MKTDHSAEKERTPARLKAALLVCLLFTLATAEVGAQHGKGFYASLELGANFAPSIRIAADANARGSICDEHLNPFTDLMPASCGDPNAPGTAWSNGFGGANGFMGGGAVGYRFRDGGRLRMELEYLFRETAYNETSPIEGRGGVAVAKLGGEVVEAVDRIGSVTSHNLFANLYLDFINRSRFTPYVGFGVGVGFTRMDHGLLWVRNSDPRQITSIAGYFPADRQNDLQIVQANLASTTSSNQTELSDSLFGYQAVIGFDYALTESVSIGLKGRHTIFHAFEDSSDPDRLRGHISSNNLDGSDPVIYTIKTDDIDMFAIGLSLKYRF